MPGEVGRRGAGGETVGDVAQDGAKGAGEVLETRVSDLFLPGAGRYFLEVAKAQSIRQAADRLGVAPSAISRQIGRLELELNTQLLERRTDGVTMTEAGRLLVEHLEAIKIHLARISGEIGDLHALRRGTVQIATVEGITRPFLSEQIARFRSAHPAVAFRLRVRGRQRVLESLEQRLSHVGFIYDHFTHSALMEVGKWRQPLLALAPAGHPMADGRPLSLIDLANEPCILPDETFGIFHLVHRAFAGIGRTPRCAVLADNMGFLRAHAVECGCITYLPLQAALDEVISGRLVPLNLDCAEFRHRHIYAVVRREQTLPPAASAFLRDVVAAFAEGERQDAAILAGLSGIQA